MQLMRRLNLILLVIAALILFLMLKGVDWAALGRQFLQNGRYWPWLLLPYGGTCYFWTLSWSLILGKRRGKPSLTQLFFIRLAGESLNQLTPTASLGGEPFKALRLNACGVPWAEATASLVIHKVVMVLSLVLYIFFCFALVPFALPAMPHRLVLASGIGALLLAAGGVGFALVQRRNPCALLLRVLKRFGLCPAILLEKEPQLTSLDAQLAFFYRDHALRGYLSLALYFLGWVLHALEVYVIFRLLGHPLSLEVALCLDALSQLFAGLGFMIPLSLGVQDTGNILLSLGFNLGATLGAAFSILRRFREAFWLCLGLVVAARDR